jgi:hypothetical protein
MRAVAAAAVSAAVRCPTAVTSSWLRPPKIWPGNTSTARSTAASVRTSQPPQISAITMADSTT